MEPERNEQIDVFFLRADHVTSGVPDERGSNVSPRKMESRRGERDPAARSAATPDRSPITERHGHDNVCFDLSPPDSRMSMDSSFEGSKSISTVSSMYSVSYQSSLNELVAMSNQRRSKRGHKVRFQLDKTRKPYEDEWSLEDFRKLSDPDSSESSSLRTCGCVCQGIAWVVVCSGMVFCGLLIHNVTSTGITLLLSQIMVTTAVQITGNPIGLLLLGLWTWSMYSSAYLLPLLTGLQNVEGFPNQQVILILLGSNMATTIFPVLVSFAFICDRNKFRRAFAAAILHYVYNVLTVILLLPIEVASGMLYHIGRGVTPLSSSKSGSQLFHTVITMITDLVVQVDVSSLEHLASNRGTILRIWCSHHSNTPGGAAGGVVNKNTSGTTASTMTPAVKCRFLLDSTGLSDKYVGAILLAVCVPLFIIIYACAIQVTKILMRKRYTHIYQTTLNRQIKGKCSPFTGCFVIVTSTLIVVILQNNFVLLCICLLLMSAGFLSLRRYYEILIGANIGGALSLFLFAQASSQNGYTAAMSVAASNAILHTFSAMVWYPIPIMRCQPIKIAKALATSAASYRWFGVTFVVLIYAVIPLALYGLCLLSGFVIIPIGLPVVLLVVTVVVVNVMQKRCPSHLPKCLRTWECVPYWLRSLEPLDSWCCASRCCGSHCCCTHKTRSEPSTDCKDGDASKSAAGTSASPVDINIVNGNGYVPASILKHHTTNNKRETIV